MMMQLLLLMCPVLATSVVLRRTPLVPLTVTGKDASSFLHAMLSADVSTLPSNSHVDACLLTGQSTLTDVVTIARGEESEWLLLCEDTSSVVRELEKRRVTEDVSFAASDAKVFDVLGGDGDEELLTRWAAGIDVLSLAAAEACCDGDAWALGGTSLRGAGGRVVVAADTSTTDAWESARVAAGRPRSGFEFNADIDSKLLESVGPLESGLAFACAEGKCYLGAELVGKRRKAPSLRCRLRGLRFEAAITIEPGAKLLAGGQSAGVLTSISGANGLAFVERKAGVAIGDAVTVDGSPATLVALDFSDGEEDDEEEVVEAPISEKERKAAKLLAMQEKLAAAGLAKADEADAAAAESARKAAKLKQMQERLAAAGLAPAGDSSSEPDDAAAAETARKAAKL